MGSVCCGCNKQIHTDYRSPVEKKGWHSHSLSERGPQPLPGQAFIAFLGTLHQGWSSFTMQSFTLGDYLLQITKEKMLLITSKKKDVCKCKGKSGWTGYTPYLGGLAQILGRYFKDMQWTFAASIQGERVLAKSKPQSNIGTVHPWFPIGKPICGPGSCVPTCSWLVFWIRAQATFATATRIGSLYVI